MDITQIGAGFKTIFAESYEAATPLWDKIAVKVDSDGIDEEYGWLGGLQGMREMHGERQPQGLKAYDFKIKNKELEESVRVKTIHIIKGRIAQYNAMVKELAANYKLAPDDMVFSLINTADSSVAYDGQNFADTDHVQGNGAGGTETWSNLGTAVLDATSFAAARLALETARNDSGRVINNAPKLVLVVPPQDRAAAEALLNQQKLANGADNPNYQAAELIVTGRISSKRWALLDVSSATARPFVWQVSYEVPFEEQGQDSHEDFFRKERFFGTYMYANAGYGEYRKAYISVHA